MTREEFTKFVENTIEEVICLAEEKCGKALPLNRWHLQPAVEAAGIQGRIGWHTFRHTYAALLKANGEDVKTVQELLRHANSLVTMNLYAQAVTQAKRQAQSRLVSMLLDDSSTTQSTALIGTKRTYEKIIQSRKLLN